jgi:hypothetical protein
MTDARRAGIVYSATRREHYVLEAFLSAHSAKELAPDLPITLFTDQPDLVYARGDCFDEVVPVDTVRTYKSLWAEGQLDRIRALRRSPYERTLHLDSDTRVCSGEVRRLFDLLETKDIAMAICQPDASICSSQTGLAMFNVGVILFRKSDKVNRLLNGWHDLTAEYFDLGNLDPVPVIDSLAHINDPEQRRKLLFMDQTSLVQLLSPTTNKFGVELEILGEEWNFRGAFGGRSFDKPIMINHHPTLRPQLANDAVQRARVYAQRGETKFAREIFQNLLDKFPMAEDGKARLRALVEKMV